MSSSVTDPGVVRRLDVDIRPPTPRECLPSGDEVVETVDLSPGWVAATSRELVTYHPDRDPAVVRTPLPNVTGLTVRRAGGQTFVQYLPVLVIYAVAALGLGVAFLAVDPAQYVNISGSGPTRQLVGIVRSFGRGMNLFGAVLVFTGILAGLAVATVLVYWVGSRDVSFVVERGSADPIECPTTRHDGTRAIEELAGLFEANDSSSRSERGE